MKVKVYHRRLRDTDVKLPGGGVLEIDAKGYGMAEEAMAETLCSIGSFVKTDVAVASVPAPEGTPETPVVDPEDLKDKDVTITKVMTREDVDAMKWNDLKKYAREELGLEFGGRIKRDELEELVMAALEG